MASSGKYRAQNLPYSHVQPFHIGQRRGVARENIPDPHLALRAMRCRLAAGQRRREGKHRSTSVGLNGHRRGIYRCQFRGVDVDPDDIARNFELRKKAVSLTDFRPDQQHHVSFGQCLLTRFLHDGATQGQGVGFRKYPFAGVGGEYGSAEHALRWWSALVRVPTAPPPTKNQRALCLREAIRSLFDRRRIGHRQGGSAASPPLLLDGLREHVPGQ